MSLIVLIHVLMAMLSCVYTFCIVSDSIIQRYIQAHVDLATDLKERRNIIINFILARTLYNYAIEYLTSWNYVYHCAFNYKKIWSHYRQITKNLD